MSSLNKSITYTGRLKLASAFIFIQQYTKKERSYLQLQDLKFNYLLFPADDYRRSVVVLWVSFIPLILNLLLLLVQLGDLQRSRGREMFRENKGDETICEKEGKQGGGRERRRDYHEVRSETWRGEAKNISLIIHMLGFDVGDSQLLSARRGLRSLGLIGVRGRGRRKAGQWIMREQQAHPESAVSVPVQQGGTVRMENNETSHYFSSAGSR